MAQWVRLPEVEIDTLLMPTGSVIRVQSTSLAIIRGVLGEMGAH
jgi:hypothetical protein